MNSQCSSVVFVWLINRCWLSSLTEWWHLNLSFLPALIGYTITKIFLVISKRCTNPRRPIVLTTGIGTVTSDVCASSILNWLLVVLLTLRIFEVVPRLIVQPRVVNIIPCYVQIVYKKCESPLEVRFILLVVLLLNILWEFYFLPDIWHPTLLLLFAERIAIYGITTVTRH